MTEIINIAYIEAKPGKRDDVAAAITKIMDPVREEPGCLQYEANVAVDNDHRFVFIETWASAEDAKRHSTSPSLRAMLGEIKDSIVEMPVVTATRRFA